MPRRDLWGEGGHRHRAFGATHQHRAFVATHQHGGIWCHPPTPVICCHPCRAVTSGAKADDACRRYALRGGSHLGRRRFTAPSPPQRAEGTPEQRPGLQPRITAKTVCVLKGRRESRAMGQSRPARSAHLVSRTRGPRPAHLGGIADAPLRRPCRTRSPGDTFPRPRGWKPPGFGRRPLQGQHPGGGSTMDVAHQRGESPLQGKHADDRPTIGDLHPVLKGPAILAMGIAHRPGQPSDFPQELCSESQRSHSMAA